jgi:phage-related protein
MVFEWIWNAISSAISNVKNWVEDRLKPVWNAINNAISTAKSYAEGLVNGIRSWVENAINTVKNWVSGLIDGVKNWVNGLINSVKSWVDGLINGVRSFAENLFNQAKNFAQMIVNNLQMSFQAFQSRVNEFMNNTTKFIQQLPAKVWEWIVEPLTNWITQLIENFVRFIFEQIADLQMYIYENSIEFTKTTLYENYKQICKQNNLPYPDREAFIAEMERYKEMGKNLFRGV